VVGPAELTSAGIRLFRQNCFPPGESTWRFPGRQRRLRALQTASINVTHRVNSSELRLLDIPSQLFFQVAEQLHALHGIKSQIEFQIVGRSQSRGAEGAASRTISEHAAHLG
jgi:hypothetical protein